MTLTHKEAMLKKKQIVIQMQMGQAIICYIDLPGYIEVELSTFITDLDIFYHTCYLQYLHYISHPWAVVLEAQTLQYLPGLFCESVGSEQSLPSWCFIILRERRERGGGECSYQALIRGTTNR